ncbi:iron-siderophore ABC transporter substrate-binding protein [Actinoalloteichus spitiensis]|uniref:ABC transporter substrate-binding protein n=1 Tax=Actinoalloteichus spitiensis TaxID=252394 RepID=UPI0002DF3165|nr:iron-siderophore ABC transporter substrate-binding protein [Actinoalloteichus spitiensis]
MRTSRALPSLFALTAVAVLTAACGTTHEAATPRTEAPEGASDQVVSIVDARGETVELPAPATRVVTLEWMHTEIVTSLGVDPVGMSDIAGYDSWVGASVPLTGDPVDVGVRREPSIDAVAELEPDLILGPEGSIPDGAVEQMERIAPIAFLGGGNASDPLGSVLEDFRSVATLLGKEDVAEQVIAEMDETIEANHAAIEEAGLAGTPVVLASPYAEGANLTIRMHGPRTAVQVVAERMGLASAWEDEGDDAFGLSNIDMEGLTALPDDTHFLYWGNDDEENVVETAMAGNPVWDNLPFVQDGNVHRAAVGVWPYGGPESLSAWSDDLVAQLVAE